LIVEHIACLVLEAVAGYVERIRQTRCRQANEKCTGSEGNDLKCLISDTTTDWGLRLCAIAACEKGKKIVPMA